jgi:hypothetical protein
VPPNALLFGAAALAFRDLSAAIGVHAAINTARWSTGETGTPGLWSMSAAEPTRARLAEWSPVIGIIVTLLATCGLWWWYFREARRRFRIDGSVVGEGFRAC